VLVLLHTRVRGASVVAVALPVLGCGVVGWMLLNPGFLLKLGLELESLRSYVLRGAAAGSVSPEASATIPRLDIWTKHWALFENNPWFGLGTFNFFQIFPDAAGYSESRILSLLVRFGWWGIFVPAYFCAVYLQGIRDKDPVRVSIAIVFIVYLLFYGSFMQSYNAVYLLMLGVLYSGSTVGRSTVGSYLS